MAKFEGTKMLIHKFMNTIFDSLAKTLLGETIISNVENLARKGAEEGTALTISSRTLLTTALTEGLMRSAADEFLTVVAVGLGGLVDGVDLILGELMFIGMILDGFTEEGKFLQQVVL